MDEGQQSLFAGSGNHRAPQWTNYWLGSTTKGFTDSTVGRAVRIVAEKGSQAQYRRFTAALRVRLAAEPSPPRLENPINQ